jgi:hypothetical protein
MPAHEYLWRRAREEVLPYLDKLEKEAKDPDFLSQFSSSLEFVDWFKAAVNPVMRLQHEIGYQWIINADVDNVRGWLKQGIYNEWAAASIIAKPLNEHPDLIDFEFINALAQQVSDESRHYHLRYNALRLYGGEFNLETYKPIKEWVELFEFPYICASKRMEFPYFHLKYVSDVQVLELTSLYHHRGVYDGFPKNQKLWEPPYDKASRYFMETFREIEDDELFHWTVAERIWLKYAKTPEVMIEALDCAIPALRYSILARVRRVELAEKHAL